ncbi:MAG TPA: CpsD/CapB family tyrosine-protein kinase [Edaphobacter sp.]|nr:CpsD/CapB family tyrosine-protein kinase [Edaphobacter sp.]
MSRFFEFLEKLNGESTATRANAAESHEALRILPVLHSPQNGDYPQPAEQIFQLRHVEVDEVHIKPETRLVFHTDPSGPAADRFRFMRMRLRTLKTLGKLKSLLITSALPQDGKSTIALNLATVMAEGGKHSVLLIEADLYHPSLAKRLDLPARSGLAECLENGVDPISLLRRLEPLHWYLLPAGMPQGNPTELLQSDSLPRVLQRLAPYFDWILIDSPPVAPLTDALLISQHVDASLVVVRADYTPREAVEQAVKLLGPKKVLGILFNAVEGLNQLYSKYSGYYGKKR